MKYNLKRIGRSGFKPFELTLVFETEEEYELFHDKIMRFLTRAGSHKFHGDVYRIGTGQVEKADGEI